MKPMPNLGLWLSLILGTAAAVLCFVGIVYLLARFL